MSDVPPLEIHLPFELYELVCRLNDLEKAYQASFKLLTRNRPFNWVEDASFPVHERYLLHSKLVTHLESLPLTKASDDCVSIAKSYFSILLESEQDIFRLDPEVRKSLLSKCFKIFAFAFPSAISQGLFKFFLLSLSWHAVFHFAFQGTESRQWISFFEFIRRAENRLVGGLGFDPHEIASYEKLGVCCENPRDEKQIPLFLGLAWIANMEKPKITKNIMILEFSSFNFHQYELYDFEHILSLPLTSLHQDVPIRRRCVQFYPSHFMQLRSLVRNTANPRYFCSIPINRKTLHLQVRNAVLTLNVKRIPDPIENITPTKNRSFSQETSPTTTPWPCIETSSQPEPVRERIVLAPLSAAQICQRNRYSPKKKKG